MPLSIPDRAKPRIVVMTDIGGDPDDRQSLVRFLLHTCDFKVEGLCAGFGWGHDKHTRPDLIREAITAYGEAVPNLRKHGSDYPDGAGSVVQPRAYRGGFDRITIRSQLNGVIGRLLDDIKLTGGQVIGPCSSPPAVNSITPTTARSDQRISLRIDGSGFPVGFTQLKLVKQGQPDIVASQVDVAADGQSLTCVLALDLYAAATGAWDVVVMTPSCPNVVASGAFTVARSTPYVAADLDHDGDVDQADFGIFQRCYSGEGVPAKPNCAN